MAKSSLSLNSLNGWNRQPSTQSATNLLGSNHSNFDDHGSIVSVVAMTDVTMFTSVTARMGMGLNSSPMVYAMHGLLFQDMIRNSMHGLLFRDPAPRSQTVWEVKGSKSASWLHRQRRRGFLVIVVPYLSLLCLPLDGCAFVDIEASSTLRIFRR